MNVIYSVKDYVTNVFDFNQATASGAIDIVAVQHEDGSFRCTPFHVHFGKAELASKVEKTVTLRVNGRVVENVHMKLGAAGEAFFVDSVESPVDDDYSTSPLVSPSSAVSATRDEAISPPSPSPPDLPPTLPQENLPPPSEEHVDEQAQWHDAYRLVSDSRTTLPGESTAPSERLSWGWGALPIVKATSTTDLSKKAEEPVAEEAPQTMVKSESVYFDAVEAENSQPTTFTDHPCMSLCGHLLETAKSREEGHTIFSEHIITFESFKDGAASYLQNPDLRFLVDGKICPFNTEIQVYLVSRVLFPSSQPPQLSCTWTSSTRHRRRQSDRIEPAFWFGDLDEEDEDEQGEDEQEEEEDESMEHTLDDAPGSSRRWFQWFPRSSSTGADSSAAPAFQPVDHNTAKLDAVQSVFYRKTLQPSQEQLTQMGLHHGTNDIEFIVYTATGTNRVSAKLFLWHVSSKIIIAEVDGAVTRVTSNRRLSTLLTTKEKDFAGPHQGAIEFYARAARNGYRIVYLTSRGLSQADLIHTMLRGSLLSREQLLPNGPVLLSPDRLLESDPDDTAVTRDFKFAALNGIRTLFPDDVNPFYAAFGKTHEDSIVFTEVGVFPGKVFLVDEGDGRLRHRSMLNFQESYSSLLGLMDKMFPPFCSPSQRPPKRRASKTDSDDTASLSQSLTSSLPSSPRSAAMPISPTASMKRVLSDEFVSDVISSHVRTRSMSDEAYNDVNFWRIKPGSISP